MRPRKESQNAASEESCQKYEETAMIASQISMETARKEEKTNRRQRMVESRESPEKNRLHGRKVGYKEN
jgi:hypothetical protein